MVSTLRSPGLGGHIFLYYPMAKGQECFQETARSKPVVAIHTLNPHSEIRQEDCQFEANLGYPMKPFLKKQGWCCSSVGEGFPACTGPGFSPALRMRE